MSQCHLKKKDKGHIAEPLRPPSATAKKAAAKSTQKRKRDNGNDMKESNGPRKRSKNVTTRVRTLKDMFNTIAANKKNAVKDKPILNVEERHQEIPKEESNCLKTAVVKELTSKDGEGPSARWGHSLCLVDDRAAVLIGGQGDKKGMCKDSYWRLDVAKGSWDRPETDVSSAHKPEARMGHTAVFDPTARAIYVYGGSKNIKWFNDVHILDLNTLKWELVKADGRAPTRAYHSSTLYRGEMWIFGGVYPQPDPQPDGCSQDMHVFSPLEKGWYDPIVMGDKPGVRSGHSATLLEDELVVFGGWDAPVSFNDLHILDLVILEWSQPSTSGKPPSPRSWHASCPLSGKRLLLHGGYNGNDPLDDAFIFNLVTRTWTELRLSPPLSARAGHSALCLAAAEDSADQENSQGSLDRIIVFGGGDNDGAFFKKLLEIAVPWDLNSNQWDT